MFVKIEKQKQVLLCGRRTKPISVLSSFFKEDEFLRWGFI
jgi:hypothetical protein